MIRSPITPRETLMLKQSWGTLDEPTKDSLLISSDYSFYCTYWNLKYCFHLSIKENKNCSYFADSNWETIVKIKLYSFCFTRQHYSNWQISVRNNFEIFKNPMKLPIEKCGFLTISQYFRWKLQNSQELLFLWPHLL